MATAVLEGVELAYQQHGEGPDLVFVHGLAANRAFWYARYALPLARHFRVTLFDLRGHGYSSRPGSGYDAPTMAGDLGALLDHLLIAQCHLVGHSYGGGVALEFAARNPGRVTKLAVLDSKINVLQPEQRLSDSPYISPFEDEIARKTAHDWEREPQVGLLFLEVLARWQLAGAPTEARDAFTPFGEGRGASRTAKQLIALLDETPARDEFARPGVAAELIAQLGVPTLLLYGEHSRCLPSLRALGELLPQAESEIVAEGGHFFPQSHGPATLTRLARFLDVRLQVRAPA